jgi:hypothetical protein
MRFLDLELEEPVPDATSAGWANREAGNLARKRVDVFGKCWIRTNGNAERTAKRVLHRAGASLRGLRSGARPGICAVCLNLGRTGPPSRFLDLIELAVIKVPARRAAFNNLVTHSYTPWVQNFLTCFSTWSSK